MVRENISLQSRSYFSFDLVQEGLLYVEPGGRSHDSKAALQSKVGNSKPSAPSPPVEVDQRTPHHMKFISKVNLGPKAIVIPFKDLSSICGSSELEPK